MDLVYTAQDTAVIEIKHIIYGPALPIIARGQFTFPDDVVHKLVLELI